MAGEEIKQLEAKIDNNKNQILEEKEILDFLKNEENVKELGGVLSKISSIPEFFSGKIKNIVLNMTLYNISFQEKIGKKIKENNPLEEQEIKLLCLQFQIDTRKSAFLSFPPAPNGQKHNTIIEKYGGQNLLNYLRDKYKNGNYQSNPTNIFQNGKTKGKNDLYNYQKIDVKLPIINFREGFSNVAFSQLEQRARENFWSEITKEKWNAEARNREKENLKDEHVKYDLLLFAFRKYTELVNKDHEKVWKQAGYSSEKEFSEQMNLAQEFYLFLDKKQKEKFPNLEKSINEFMKYQKEQEELEKSTFKDEKEKQKAKSDYSLFSQELQEIGTHYDVSKLSQNLTQEPKTPEDAQIFFNGLSTLSEYQEKAKQLKGKYGNSHKYEKYLNQQNTLINKYGRKNLESRAQELKEYETSISSRKKAYSDIDFTKYEKYTTLFAKTRLSQDFNSLHSIQKILLDPSNNSFPIFGIKEAELQKKAKQKKIDERWGNMKKYGVVYDILNTGASFYNGLIDATISVGSGLGLMIMRLYKTEDERIASSEYKQKFDDVLRINLSSNQKESVYNSESGVLNFNRENGVSQVASGIANMLTLISGGGAIAKGITKGGTKLGLGITEKVASRAGLFTFAFNQQVGQSFQEGISSGMTGTEALAYSFLSSSLQGGLELVSPNEILLGKGSGLAKGFIKELCKSGSKNSLKQVGKLFLKNIGSEVVEENIQEALQLCAGNLMNERANGRWIDGKEGRSKLPSDWNLNNFAATAIITTLTTGITTGTSFAMQTPGMLNIADKTTLKMQIIANPGLYNDVIGVLNQALNGNLDLGIPNDQLLSLQGELESFKKKDFVTKGDQKENLNKNNDGSKTEYFEGKESKLGLSETQARENSQMMDTILSEITETNQAEKLQKLRGSINQQYQEATGNELYLSDEQLLSLMDAHEQDGILGELTKGQLKKKVRILAETILDPKVRRFLLEAGLSGRELIPLNNFNEFNIRKKEFERKWGEFSYDMRNLITDRQYNKELKEFLDSFEWRGKILASEINLDDKDICLDFLRNHFNREGKIRGEYQKYSTETRIDDLAILLNIKERFGKEISAEGLNNKLELAINECKLCLDQWKKEFINSANSTYQWDLERFDDFYKRKENDYEIIRFKYLKHFIPSYEVFSKIETKIQYMLDRIIPDFSDILGSQDRYFQYRQHSERIKDHIEGTKGDIEKDINTLFNIIPKLKEIGTQQDYFNYLQTIFPESLVRNIFCHATKSKDTFNEFDLGFGKGGRGLMGPGIYLTGDSEFLRRNQYEGSEAPLLVIINTKNPYFKSGTSDRAQIFNKKSDALFGSNQRIPGKEYSAYHNLQQDKRNTVWGNVYGTWSRGIKINKTYKKMIENKIDFHDFIADDPLNILSNEKKRFDIICIPDTKNTHILGTDKDIEMFSEFMKKSPSLFDSKQN